MDQTTIDQLNKINRDFYTTIAASFHATRHDAWQGWTNVIDTISERFDLQNPIAMLDVGCGNGRWAKTFFEITRASHVKYMGIDENRSLLQYACQAILPYAEVLDLVKQDAQAFLIENTEKAAPEQFQIIVLFGIWHHFPGSEYRLNLLHELSRSLAPNGILIISCWRFLRSQKLADRLHDPALVKINPKQLETGDYLLDWRSGNQAIRYCHDTDREEMVRHILAAGLQIEAEFSADGKTGNLNDYYIITHQQLLAHSAEGL